MARLSKIQHTDIKPITVEYNGLELHFKVDPTAYTIGWQKKFGRAADNNDIEGISDTFFSLVKEWDITDDNDELLPLDSTAFDQITLPTFTALAELIMEKLVPNARTRS